MNTTKTFSKKWKLVLFYPSFLLWIFSYPFLWFGGASIFNMLITNYFHYDLYGFILDLFLLPLLPLGLSLFFGKRLFKDGHLFCFFAGALLLFIGLFYAFGTFLLIIPWSWVLITHFLIVALYLLLKNKLFSKSFILSYGVSSILVIFMSLSLASFLTHTSLPDRKRDCVESTTSWSDQVFFLEPLTKNQIAEIVQDGQYPIRQLAIAPNKDSKGYVISLTSNITAANVQESIHTYADFDSDLDNKFSIKAKLTLDAYDNNEPVVWGIAFPEMSMEKFAQFYYEWDAKKHQVGEILPVPQYMFLPTEIRPPSAASFSLERQCYPD